MNRRLSVIALCIAVLLAGGIVALTRGGEGDRKDAAEAEGGRPVRGGQLRIGLTPFGSLDPVEGRDPEQLLAASQVFELMFDSLTAYDPSTLEPVPAVAERWQASADQKEWDFFIDADAAFSDGRPITAADVKFTFERIARKDTRSSVEELLEPVAGYRAARVDGTTTDLAGITVPAPNVVHITLDQPMAELPSILSNAFFGIVPRDAAEATAPTFAERPVGSGPFRFESRDGGVLRLRRATTSPALVESVEVSEFKDLSGVYKAFVDGKLDWGRVPPEKVEDAASRYGRTAFRPYLAELFYGFNLRSPKFADVRFREAIVRSVKRKAIVTAVYQNTVSLIDGVVVDGVLGHEDGVCGDRCTYDPERSRALLKEVFGEGPVPEVLIDFDDDPTQESVARTIEEGLEDVGIPATLRSKPLTEYQTFAVSGQQELFRLGWIAPYPSIDAFLGPLFLSTSRDNLTGLASPAVDEKLRAARAEADPDTRVKLYQEAEKAVMDQVPVLPIAQFELQTVVSPRVRNLRLTAVGTFDASRVWLGDT